MLYIIQKILLYGCIGILIENLFTSLHSLYYRNWALTTRTYGWMLPVYGVAALFLEAISVSLPWPFYLKAFVYVPVIYGVEALSGWTIKVVTGYLQRWFGGINGNVIPWDYKHTRWTPLGLINLKYAPAWLLVAMAFEPISVYLRILVNYLATVN